VAHGDHGRGAGWRCLASGVTGERRQDKLSEPDEQDIVGLR
jgi:hypothetical protein